MRGTFFHSLIRRGVAWGGLAALAASSVGAAEAACTPDRLAGDWSIEAIRKDGSPGSIRCGLGVDRDGRITWSTCHRGGLFGGWFRIEGTLALLGEDGRVEGRAHDGVFDIAIDGTVSGCGVDQRPAIKGMLKAGKGVLSMKSRFVGQPMSAREVRQLERSHRRAVGASDCDTAAEGCRP
jgi:hypothetical protein